MISHQKIWFTLALIAASNVYICKTASAQDTPSIGDSVVAYLRANVGERVGGGNSWHMATEALRVAGGEFITEEFGTDNHTDNRVWGTLVTTISSSDGWSDSEPSNPCLPGDVIQFSSAAFGSISLPWHFTAVVDTVNDEGRPNSIFIQNLGGNRTVQQLTFDVSTLSEGWMRIYRPVPRTDRLNEWKFIVVNNDASTETYQILIGVESDGQYSPTAAGSSGSYHVHWIVTDGTVPNLLSSTGRSYFLETGKGFEIFSSSGAVGIRQLSE